MGIYTDTVLATPGLVSVWELGDASGNAVDLKSGYSAQYIGGPSRAEPSVLPNGEGKSVKLNGTSQYVNVSDQAALRLGDVMSLECWFNLDSFASPCAVISGMNGAAEMAAYPTEGLVLNKKEIVGIVASKPTLISVGSGYHLVITKNGATVKLYINGVDVTGAVSNSTLEASAGDWKIGRNGTLSLAFLQGRVQFPAFYNVALSASTVGSHFGASLVAPDVVPVGAAVVREEPRSGRLAFYVRRSDGTEKRLAGDEDEAEDIAQGFVFGTSIPGGYGNANMSFARDPRIEYGDFGLFDEFIARGPGNESAFEGYDIEIPSSGGEQVDLVATGWSGSLKDNPTFQEIYIDRDLGRWTSPSAARKILVLSSNYAIHEASVVMDPTAGLPAIELGWEGTWPAGWSQDAEALYDAGPTARIARIYFSFKGLKDVASNFAFALLAHTASADTFISGIENTGDVYTGAAEGSVVFTPTAKNRFGALLFQYGGGPAGQDGVPYKMQLRNVLVVGDTTAPIKGSSPSNYGVLASDVVADIISRAAPLLRYTTGGEGSIQASSYVVPHMIFPEALTAEEAILQASKYDVPDWGVYDDRLFFWRPPDAGRLWVARQGDPECELKDTGKQAEDVYTGVMVQFTDPSGKTFLVGPPGTRGCDYTDASLVDASETNPLNERGRVRLGKLVVSAVTTLSGAIQIGSRWLQEELAVSDRGAAVLTGFVQDSAGNFEPVWKVRAGDRIRFDDADGRERRIIETSYNHEERTNSLTLDSTPHRLEALMERMQVELIAVGSGS